MIWWRRAGRTRPTAIAEASGTAFCPPSVNCQSLVETCAPPGAETFLLSGAAGGETGRPTISFRQALPAPRRIAGDHRKTEAATLIIAHDPRIRIRPPCQRRPKSVAKPSRLQFNLNLPPAPHPAHRHPPFGLSQQRKLQPDRAWIIPLTNETARSFGTSSAQHGPNLPGSILAR